MPIYNALNIGTTGTNLSVYKNVHGLSSETSFVQYRSGVYSIFAQSFSWSIAGPVILGSTSSSEEIKSLQVTEKTSTNSSSSNTIYVGTTSGVSIINEIDGYSNNSDGSVESLGSVKFYTSDFVSEEMIGDIRGMWPLSNARSDVDIEDVSPKANHLTGTNITANGDASVGIRNTATNYDGSTESLTRADDSDLDFAASNNFSIGMWFKHNGTISTSSDYLITKADTTNGGYKLHMSSTGTICFDIDDDATFTPDDSACSTKRYDDSNWHHVVAVKNGTNSIQLYVDGLLNSADSSIAATGTLANTNAFYIGVDRDGTSNEWDGDLDEAFVTATALNPAQIKNMYQVGMRSLMSQGSNGMGSVAYTNDPAAGSNITLDIADTNGIFAGDSVIVSSSAGTETAIVSGVSLNTNITVNNLTLNHTTTNPTVYKQTYQHLGYYSAGTDTVGSIAIDENNQYLYVGLNSTTAGGLSKIQINSDSVTKLYTASSNSPASGAIILDEDVNSLAVGETLYAVGSAASGVKTMGLDNNATTTSGNFVSKTHVLPKNIGSAVLWVSPILDSSDGSNTLTVQASNDGGGNYVTCTLVNTNTNYDAPEREYACTFTTADNDLKVRFQMARGSTKTNTYIVQYGISWLGETGFRVEQADNNNVRLYNFSGESQNLRLNVTGGGTSVMANPWTDGGSYIYATGYEALRIYDGAGTNYLGLSHDGTYATLGYNGTDYINLTSAGDILPETNDTQALGSDTKRWKDIFLGGDTMHIGTSLTDEATIAYNTTTNILGIDTDSTTNGDIAFFTDDLYLDKSTGNVGIGDTSPSALFTVGNGDMFKVNSSGELTIGTGTGTTTTTDITFQNGETLDNNTDGILLTSGQFKATSHIITDGAFYGPTDDTPTSLVSTGHLALHLDNDDDTSSSRLLVYDGEDTILLDVNQQTKASDATADFNASLQINTYADDNERLCHSGADGATLSNITIRDCTVAGEDFAEWALIDRPSEPGELVYTLGPDPNNPNQTLKTISSEPYQLVTGVISTNPYIDVLGDEQYKNVPNARPIALAGRVPVKVSIEGGVIKTGDPLTASSLPGVAMKATKAATIIGFAEEDYDGTTKITPQVLDQERIYNSDLDDRTAYNSDPSNWPEGVGKIMMDFKITYHDPDIYLTSTGDLHITKTGSDYQTEHVERGLIDRIGAYSDLFAANVQAGLLTVNEIIASNIKIDNLNLGEYIRSIIQNELQTAPLSPLAGDIPAPINGPVTITSDSSAQSLPTLTVEGGVEATTVSARIAKIQEIQTEKITARDIVADTITANTIVGLDAKIASLSAGISESDFETISDRIKSRLASLTGGDANSQDIPAPEPLPDTVIEYSELSTSSATLASADIDFATINNYLAVIGQATITTLDVTNGLYTDTINSKTGRLALAEDTLLIDSDGQVMINGDLTVSGKILADSGEFNSLSLGTPSSATSSSALGQLLAVYNEQGQAVATIDASGSANLASLTTNMITIASPSVASQSSLATLLGTAQSNSTAGENTLTTPNTELTIESPYVTTNSLVYLTPTTNTDNKVLFVKSKTSCDPQTPNSSQQTPPCTPSFTVGIDGAASSDISFNWWIIELKNE
ncbi:MAG: LamG domain-containing protein [Candidatus Moraniibacteriota bacterium]|nr:MAG: LamG domain-containing protein [Candidatus Moranbacteria bacterium]